MRVRIVSIGDITPELVAMWNAWAAPAGRLVSPYFCFKFAATVAAARRDVRVAVFEDADGIAGFFAHHAPNGGVVRPVGAPMSDYQGAIMRPGVRLDMNALAKATGASAVVFDNWFAAAAPGMTATAQAPAGYRDIDGSAVADLAGGAQAYFDSRRALHRDHFKKADRRLRAAERDHGPVRVELGDPDGLAFARLSAWKERQYRETGKLNVFGIRWVHEVLTALRAREGEDFGGLTASLWFGDRLAAAEFGLTAGGVYHSWFPAYDPDLARYSPGLLLLHGLFEQAQERDIDRVDLGGGQSHYKKYYASYDVPLARGRVLRPGMAALGIRGWEYAESLAGVMPERLAALPARLRRRWAQVSAFQPEFAPRLASFAGSISL